MEAFRQQAVTLQLREAKAETSSKDHAASHGPTRDVLHCHHRVREELTLDSINQQQMSECRKTLQEHRKCLSA